jgi:uncharacterized Fe-S cluster-containing radical SAM superfamily protein
MATPHNPEKPVPNRKRRRFNWIISDLLRRFLTARYEWGARLRGERFYCKVLSGESEYNLTVNCDLTVSCNCQDYDGSGHLGDLNRNTFRDVYYGPVAQRFREELAKGKLPIKTCARCGDLARVPKSQVRKTDLGVIAGPEPKLPHRGMLLENTVRCNIDCIGCDRQSAARIRTSLQMDLEKLSRMADLVRELGLEQLFYLNLGEPFLSPNIGKELPVLREKNPDCRIVISTNGIVLNTDAKREAALHASHILFSIAGIDDAMLKKYERYGSFEKAYANMKALVDYRNARGLEKPIIEWKYLLFNWNDKRAATDRAIEMAKAANVDMISFWPTNNPFYGYSFRYRLGLLNHIGVACWKGRELDLRNPRGVEANLAVPA